MTTVKIYVNQDNFLKAGKGEQFTAFMRPSVNTVEMQTEMRFLTGIIGDDKMFGITGKIPEEDRPFQKQE